MNPRKQFRLSQWWQPKSGLIMSMVYLAVLVGKIGWTKELYMLFAALITILGIGALGHLLNDFFDLESDRKAEKKNTLEQRSAPERLGLFALSVSLAAIPWIWLPLDKLSLVLLVLEGLLLLFYAVPPIRFKERGVLALIADSAYAYTIPSVLAFHTFLLVAEINYPSLLLLGLATIWLFLAGFQNVAIHQIEDYPNDIKSNTYTWAIKFGPQKLGMLILRWIYPLHLVSFLTFFYFLSFFTTPFIFMFPALWVMIQLLSNPPTTFPNQILPPSGFLQRYNLHYHRVLPYGVLIILGLIDSRFFLLLLLHFFVFHPKLPIDLIQLIKGALSFAVNHSILLFRRLVLRESDIQARRLADSEKNVNRGKQDGLATIAVINQNRNKYTETFVIKRSRLLPFNILFFYGEGGPKSEMTIGNLNPFGWLILEWFKLLHLTLGFSYNPSFWFDLYLKAYRPKLVWAEFGPTGVEVLKSCQALGIPLIPVFHGYGAHHKYQTERLKTDYLDLFEYSSAVVGVSRDIVQKLIKMGCPEDKLVYQPDYVDLNLFEYCEFEGRPPVFLAVGRFSETKSPHLTLLAFKKVLEKHPEAKLEFVGSGELHEACMIMVRAFCLTDSVVFTGPLSPEEVLQKMQSCYAFVQHSLTTPLNSDKEGTPVAIMEAMATGIPIVSTRHAGIEEMIEDGISGLLIDEYDVDGMAKAMCDLLNNPLQAAELGRNASQSIRSNPIIAGHIDKMTHLINKYRLK